MGQPASDDLISHCISAVCRLTGETEVYVVGSQAIAFALRREGLSVPKEITDHTTTFQDIDIVLKHEKADMSPMIKGILGEGTPFAKAARTHVQILYKTPFYPGPPRKLRPREGAVPLNHSTSKSRASLPPNIEAWDPNWKTRLVRLKNTITGDYTGWMFDLYDQILRPLQAFRDKDIITLRRYLHCNLFDTDKLRKRIGETLDATIRNEMFENLDTLLDIK